MYEHVLTRHCKHASIKTQTDHKISQFISCFTDFTAIGPMWGSHGIYSRSKDRNRVENKVDVNTDKQIQAVN